MLKIGEFSSLAKTTIKTLRYYDEIDLFKPADVDENGYRYYNLTQLAELQRIIELRHLEMPIEEIKAIIAGGDIINALKKQLLIIEDKQSQGKLQISLIKKYMANAKKGDFMKNYSAKEVLLPKCIVYYRHGVIKNMGGLVPFILEAGAEAKENNPTLKCTTPEYCFVCYSAKEYKENNVELEYAEAVEAFGKESKNIKFKELAETRAVCIEHEGPYSSLGKAYAYALQVVKENGYEISGDIRECYIHGCWDCENEADYLTEIQIPIK